MVYLIAYHFKSSDQGKWNSFESALKTMGATPVVGPNVWLVESGLTAPELYLEVGRDMDLPYFDALFVTEITANSIGTYFTGARKDASTQAAGRAVATLVGKARRD